MAQLDLGLLQFFMPIFMFIIIFVILYSLLTRKKYISENESINAMIAFISALILVSQYETLQFLANLLPGFLFMAISMIFFLLIFSFIGYKSSDLDKGVYESGPIMWTIVVIGFFITAWSAGQVFGQDLLSITEPGASNIPTSGAVEPVPGSSSSNPTLFGNVGEILFNPKVLGMLFVLILAALVIFMLTYSE